MVKDKLLSVFNLEDIQLIKNNQEFNFTINLACPKDQSYKILFTEGLSKNIQNVDDKFIDYKQIELYICLPEYWNLDKYSWPIETLNRIAESPIKNKSWFGPGDTISTDGPKKSVSKEIVDVYDTEFNYYMLSDPLLIKELVSDNPEEKEAFRFLAVFPIHKKEFDYKMRNSATVLLKKIQLRGYSEQIDVYRKSVCRNRILGMI